MTGTMAGVANGLPGVVSGLPDVLTGLILVYALVFLINVVPAFMPPTWSILAFFLIRFDLPLLPLALGGAIAASLGRTALALLSRRFGRRMLTPERHENLLRLGQWLEERARWATPIAVLVYSFGPIPSNQLFIAVGLAEMRLAPVVAAFFVGRVISYTFWAFTAHEVIDRLDNVFVGYWSNLAALAFQIAVIVLLVIFTRIDWPKVLHLPPLPGSPPPTENVTRR